MSMPDWEEGVDGSARIKHYLEAVGERHQSAKRQYLFGAVVVSEPQPEYRQCTVLVQCDGYLNLIDTI